MSCVTFHFNQAKNKKTNVCRPQKRAAFTVSTIAVVKFQPLHTQNIVFSMIECSPFIKLSLETKGMDSVIK